MLNVQADLKEEKAIIEALSGRMDYFDGLMENAHTLVKEAAGVLETTKTFKQALTVAKTVLERDYTPEDIAENLGDVDFANDFAEELEITLNELVKSCEDVSADCLDRKHRLDNALIWPNDAEFNDDEELIELDDESSEDNDLGL